MPFLPVYLPQHLSSYEILSLFVKIVLLSLELNGLWIALNALAASSCCMVLAWHLHEHPQILALTPLQLVFKKTIFSTFCTENVFGKDH